MSMVKDGATGGSRGRGSHLRMHMLTVCTIQYIYVHNVHTHVTHVCITLLKYIQYRHDQKGILGCDQNSCTCSHIMCMCIEHGKLCMSMYNGSTVYCSN